MKEMKCLRVTVAAVLMLAVLMLAGTGFCAEEDEDVVYKLGEIVVTGERECVQKTATVDIVTATELEKVKSVAEALVLLPGIHIRRGPRGEAYVRTRGFRQREVLILINGIPINSPYTGQNDLAQIPTESISKIVFEKGAVSTLYGPNAIGGVINIITKKGTKDVRAFVKGEMAEENTSYAQTGLGGRKGMLNYFVSGHILDSDGYPLSDDFEEKPLQDEGRRVNSDRERQGVFLNLGLDPGSQSSLAMTLNYVTGQYGIPPIVEDGKPLGLSSPKFERVDDFRHYDISLAGETMVTSAFSLRGAVYQTHYYTKTTSYDDANYTAVSLVNSGQEKARDRTEGMNLYGRMDLAGWGVFKLGFSVKNDQRETKGYQMIADPNDVPTEMPYDMTLQTRTYSFGLEYEISPWETAGVILGLSHDMFDKRGGKDNQTGAYISEGSNDYEWCPQIGAFFYPRPETKLHASVAQKMRFPSLRELYETTYKKKTQSWVSSGNADLKSEKSMNYELGIEQQVKDKATLRIAYFYHDIDNLIERNDSTQVYENVPAVAAQGVETNIDLFPKDNLFVNLNYTYLSMKDKSTFRNEIQYRPRHKLSWSSHYIFPTETKVELDGFFAGDQYFYNSDYSTKFTLGDYAVFNLRVLQPLTGYLTLYAGVHNVFDKDYYESYALPQPGRFFYGGVKLAY